MNGIWRCRCGTIWRMLSSATKGNKAKTGIVALWGLGHPAPHSKIPQRLKIWMQTVSSDDCEKSQSLRATKLLADWCEDLQGTNHMWEGRPNVVFVSCRGLRWKYEKPEVYDDAMPDVQVESCAMGPLGLGSLGRRLPPGGLQKQQLTTGSTLPNPSYHHRPEA